MLLGIVDTPRLFSVDFISSYLRKSTEIIFSSPLTERLKWKPICVYIFFCMTCIPGHMLQNNIMISNFLNKTNEICYFYSRIMFQH